MFYSNYREGFHRDLAHQKAEFSKLYEDKLKNLKEKLENERINNAGSFQEMREMETKVTGLTSRNMELESMSASLNARISQLMQEIDDMGRNHRGEMTRKVIILTRVVFIDLPLGDLILTYPLWLP